MASIVPEGSLHPDAREEAGAASTVSRTVTALLICAGAALLVSVVLRSIAGGLIAEAAAIVCFALHPTVEESLERKRFSFSSKLYAPWIAALSGLTHPHRSAAGLIRRPYSSASPWYVVVASAAVLFTLLDVLIGFVLGFTLRIVGIDISRGGAVTILVFLAINCVIAFRIGSWMGAALPERPYRLAFAAVVCAQIMGQTINAVIGAEEVAVAIAAVIFGSIVWAIPAFMGVWYGERHRSTEPEASSRPVATSAAAAVAPGQTASVAPTDTSGSTTTGIVAGAAGQQADTLAVHTSSATTGTTAGTDREQVDRAADKPSAMTTSTTAAGGGQLPGNVATDTSSAIVDSPPPLSSSLDSNNGLDELARARTEESREAARKCHKCGEEVLSGARFCLRCGSPVTS